MSKFGNQSKPNNTENRHIETPSNKAAFGEVCQIVDDICAKSSGIDGVAEFFGSIVTGKTSVSGNGFKGKISNVTKDNLFVKISSSLTTIAKLKDDISKQIYEISDRIAQMIDLQSQYFSLIINSSPDGQSSSNSEISFVIDTKNAANLDKIFDALSRIDPGTADSLDRLYEVLEKLTYSDFKGIDKNFIQPMNCLSQINSAEISNAMSVLMQNNTVDNIEELLDKISKINFVDKDVIELMKAISAFSNSIVHLQQLPSVVTPEQTDKILEALKSIEEVYNYMGKMNFDASNAANLIDISQKSVISVQALADSSVQMSTALEQTATSMKGNKAKIKAIVSGYEDLESMAEEVDDTESLNSESIVASTKLLSAVIISIGTVILVGALFAKKNPTIIKDVLKFSTATAIFLAMIGTTLVAIGGLANLIDSDSEILDSMNAVVIKMTATMLIGALVYKFFGEKISKHILQFTKDLMIFIGGVGLAMSLVTAIGDSKNAISSFGESVAKLAVTMMIGALFVSLGNGKMVKAALAFTAVFTLFIFGIALPIRYMQKGMFKDTSSTLRSLTLFVATMSLILMLGAAFMLLGGGKYAIAAIGFGLIVAGFVALMASILKKTFGGIASLFKGVVMMKAIQAFTDFIMSCATILMIGGVFMLLGNGKFAYGAIAFAILLSGFILITSLAIKLIMFNATRKAALAIFLFMNTVVSISLILMIGALFMSEAMLAKNALNFALLVAGFVMGLCLTFAFVSLIFKRKVENDVGRFMLAVTALSVILMIGTLFVSAVGVVKTAAFAAILTGFIYAVCGAMKHIAENSKELEIAAKIALEIAAFVAILSVSMLIVHLAAKNMKWEELGMFGAMVAVMVGIVCALTINKIRDNINKASEAATKIAEFTLIMAGAFFIITYAATDNNWEGFGMFCALVVGMVAIFAVMGAPFVKQLIADAEANAITISLFTIIMAGAFFIVTKAATDNAWEALGIFGAMVGGMIAIFALLGVPYVSILISIGSSAALLAGSALLLIGLAFEQISKLAKLDVETGAKKVGKGVDAIIEPFSKLTSHWKELIGAGVVASSLSKAIKRLSGAFKALEKVKNSCDITLVNNINKMLFGNKDLNTITDDEKVGGIIGTLRMLRKYWFVLGVTKKVARDLKIAIRNIGFVFDTVHRTLHESKLTENDITDFGKMMNKVIDIPNGIDGKKLVKIGIKSVAIGAAMLPFLTTSASLMEIVRKFSSLKIPVQWNSAGVPTRYMQLSPDDFTKTTSNISEAIASLFDGFIKITDNDKYKDMFSSFGSETTIGGIMSKLLKGSSNNTLSQVFRATRAISSLISDVGENIANFASLKVPQGFDNNGNPTSYRQLTPEDFSNASKSIENLLTLVYDSIINCDLDKKIIGAKKKVKNSLAAAEILVNLSTALKAYAEMRIPIEFSADGNPTKFLDLSKTDMMDAVGTNIGTVMSTLTDAVNKGATAKVSRGAIKQFKRTISAASETVEQAVKTIQSIAELKFPIYSENSTKIVGYTSFSSDNFDTVKKNILDVMNCMPDSVKEAYALFKDKNINADDIKSMSDAYTPFSTMLNDLITAIRAYATLKKIPITDGEGKIVDYIELDLNEDLKSMGTNVARIVVGLGTAIKCAYDQIKGNDQEAIVANIIQDISPIATIFSSLINSVVAYADLKVPKYNNKGEVIGYYNLVENQNEMNGMFSKISQNIQTIIVGLATAVGEAAAVCYAQGGPLAANGDNITKLAIKMNEFITPVQNIIETVKNYSELKFPKAYDKDGKVTSYESIDTFDATKFRDKLSEIITAVPNAIDLALQNDIVKQFISDNSQLMKDTVNFVNVYTQLMDYLNDTIFASMQSIAEFKIPVEFDKDGKPTKYIDMNNSNYSLIEKNITNLICALPNAISNAISKLDSKSIDINVLETFTSNISELFKTFNDTFGSEITSATLSCMTNVDSNINSFNAMAEGMTLIQNSMSSIMNSVESINDAFKVKDMNDALYHFRNAYDAISTKISDLKKLNRRKAQRAADDIINAKDFFVLICKEMKTMYDSFNNIGNAFESTALENNTKYLLNSISTVMNCISNATIFGEESDGKLKQFATKKAVQSKIDIMLETVSKLNELYKNVAEIQNNSMENASFDDLGKIFKEIESHAEEIDDSKLKKFSKETKSLSNYVKTIEKINVQKVSTVVKLFDSISRLAEGVGSLDKFTSALADELSTTLNELTEEIKESKMVIAMAERQKVQRQHELDQSIEKIEKLMNKPLNVNVSSGSADKINAVYETPKS